jgi:hypothetical protein
MLTTAVKNPKSTREIKPKDLDCERRGISMPGCGCGTKKK